MCLTALFTQEFGLVWACTTLASFMFTSLPVSNRKTWNTGGAEKPHSLLAHKCPHVQPTCSCYPTFKQMHLRNRQCRLLLHTCAPDLPRSPPSDQANLNLSMSLNKVERVGYEGVGSFWTLPSPNPCNK